jgi:hypothetical protein
VKRLSLISRTSDSEFDELLVKFVAASKAGENMQRAWLTQLKWLEEQQSSINLAIDAVDTACGANTTTPAVALTLYVLSVTHILFHLSICNGADDGPCLFKKLERQMIGKRGVLDTKGSRPGSWDSDTVGRSSWLFFPTGHRPIPTLWALLSHGY